ncbi:MAG: hypothetical protein KR126chlam6_01063 [Candidatus Anoxychlamydiales bacterium]|nr:hypothetical protein [Candidatus Anoxychlamydiales bacterium]
MANKRKKISRTLERKLFQEAGWRCAVPTCPEGNVSLLQMAHIIPVEKDGKDEFDNMIVLCSNCHIRFDKDTEKTMDRKSMRQLKRNLSIINGRYSHFEFRVLEYFFKNKSINEIELYGRDLDVMYLINDGLLEIKPVRLQNAINFPPKIYLITKKGKEFIEHWTNIESLDEKLI